MVRGRELFKAIGDRTAPTRQIIDWVFNNAGRPVETIPADEFPSYGAVGLLEYANKDYAAFIENIWSKTIPTKAQLERQEQLKDDGREQLTIIENMEKELAALPEEHQREPALPPQAA